MTALRHFRKPDVEVIGDEVIVVGTRLQLTSGRDFIETSSACS